MKKNYRRTLLACYLGFITQAIAANFAPLLFLTFHGDYQISLGQIALIPTAFYVTQLTVDALCAAFAAKINYRQAIIVSQIASALGLFGMAFLPELLPNPFVGVIICVIIYAIGSGLIEVLVSPIIEACPFDNKDAVMSLTHSFYCWGSVGVVLLSTVFFAVFGVEHWKILTCIWALVPLYNIVNFATCPIEYLVEDGKSMSVGKLCKTGLFWLAVLLMVCSGASEMAMAQWASAYAESALGLSKTLGDLVGPCLFAVTMGICRVFYGKWGHKVDLTRFMLGSGLMCLACYILASLTTNPVWGLVGCIACGFSVAIMWPGTLSIPSAKLPLGGTAMFALLAMAGDLGGAFGPSVVGNVAQAAGDDLRVGLRLGCVFPIVLVLGLLVMMWITKKQKKLQVNQ